jgi:hypothetical protein
VDPVRRETLRRKIDDMLVQGANPWDLPLKLD